jgi:hypothetical protein
MFKPCGVTTAHDRRDGFDALEESPRALRRQQRDELGHCLLVAA